MEEHSIVIQFDRDEDRGYFSCKNIMIPEFIHAIELLSKAIGKAAKDLSDVAPIIDVTCDSVCTGLVEGLTEGLTEEVIKAKDSQRKEMER